MLREAKIRGKTDTCGRSPSGRVGNERGFVVIAVLLAVAVLLVVVVSVSAVASGESRATPFWRDRGEALYVAESGLNHCLWKLKFNRTTISLREGVYPTDPATFTSSSEPETKITVGGQVQDAITGNSSYQVWVKTNALDSAECAVTVVGKVGAQSYVLKATLHQENIPFSDPNGDGIGNTSPDTVWNLPPDTDGIANITVRSQDVILSGGTYVVDFVDASSNGSLIFTGDAVVWVRQYIRCSGTGVINPDGAPTVPADQKHTVIFYMPPVAGATVDISGTTHFYGFVYAPTAKIKVAGNTDVYGCLVGESLKVQGSTTYNALGNNIGFPVSTETNWKTSVWGQ
jgi:hypothetical protein